MKIAILPGDGIGTEIVEQAVRVLNVLDLQFESETALVGAVVFHALNGLRIILVDYWSKGTKYQRALFWIVIALWVVVMLGFAPRHLMNVFGH